MRKYSLLKALAGRSGIETVRFQAGKQGFGCSFDRVSLRGDERARAATLPLGFETLRLSDDWDRGCAREARGARKRKEKGRYPPRTIQTKAPMC